MTNRREIQSNFIPILRTSILSVIKKQEHYFQRSLITNLDTITAIGQDVNADFVIAGSIQSFKGNNFLFINIMDINTRQLVAGDYKQFKKKEDIPALLIDMAKKIVRVPGNKNKDMLELAVLPFSIPESEATVRETEVLAQIASIEIMNSGKYVVLPRTNAINQALGQKLFEPSALGDRIVLQNLGKALNAKYILAGQTGSIGTKRYISMQIVNLEDGWQLRGSDAEYQTITDCINRIPLLAQVISDQKTEAAWREMREDKRRFWSIGANVGSMYGVPPLLGIGAMGFITGYFSVMGVGWGILGGLSCGIPFLVAGGVPPVLGSMSGLFSPGVSGNINTTLAPFPYSFLELGCDALFINPNGTEGQGYISFYPYANYNIFIGPEGYENGGCFIGLGSGRMFTIKGTAERIDHIDLPHDKFTLNAVLGGKIGKNPHYFDVRAIAGYDFYDGIYYTMLCGYSFRIKR
ncbi:MAG: hypothetical protein LBH44_13900 [Treponema sp.]|nr:hypothetical protein [Treponema sp.]